VVGNQLDRQHRKRSLSAAAHETRNRNAFLLELREQGGIPQGARKKFPMPIFEGANCPAPDEISTIMDWLDRKGFLSRNTPYEELINPRFLPNPDDVGLAFCCR